MNPGILKHRIKVYRQPDPELDLDEIGQPLKEPIFHTSLWAAIFPLRGKQIESARQYHEDVTIRIVIRYRDDLDATMFAMYENTKFDFLYLLHVDYAKKEIHIFAKEAKNG